MSRPRIVLSVSAVIVLLTLTAGAAAVSFPLVGGPADRPSVTSRIVDGPADESSVAAPRVQEPVRVGGDVKPPKKTRDERPVYPPDAREAGVQGVVILEVLIAPDGTVADAKELRSVPLLDQAALDAVRQWQFEPTRLNGVPVPVVMTVTVNFTLDAVGLSGTGHVVRGVVGGVPGGVVGGVVGGVPGGVPSGVPRMPPPKKIFDVKPVYPPEARDAGIQGVVIVQTSIGIDGTVVDAKVLRSIPMLDEAALDAVRQWRFEPIPAPMKMTASVSFTLNEGGARGGAGAGGRPSPGSAGRLFDLPRPGYPAEAIAAKVEGTVVLDAVIGASGKVVSVKLVEGPGLLAKAAIDAVRQWGFPSITSPHTARIEIDYSLKDGRPAVTWGMKISETR